MKLEIVNRGEYRVKVMERGEEKGTLSLPIMTTASKKPC